MGSVYDFSANALDGREIPLETYRGRVLLIVNTASRCGFTPQYAGLEELQHSLAPRGFSVLGFPCNQFGGQEPGSAKDIAEFCLSNYGITFPLFAKIDVNGDNAHPLFKFLTRERPGLLGAAIKWNFTKFVIDRHGMPVSRHAPTTAPRAIASELIALLDRADA